MEQLTAQQAKMVIEYFAAQAAEDAPSVDADWRGWEKHQWMTRMQASLAIEKQITNLDWYLLLEAMTNYQSFDRDPEAYLHQQGGEGYTQADIIQWQGDLEDQVSWQIDNAYGNAGA